MQRTACQFALALLVGTATPAIAEDTLQYANRFGIMNPDLQLPKGKTPSKACSAERSHLFWNVLAAIQEEREYGRKLRGDAKLALQADDSRVYDIAGGTTLQADPGDPDVHTLKLGLSLRRGTYPGEFKFSAAVDVRLEAPELTQSVRDIFVAYDHWMSPFAEAFVFGSQFSDSFMRIDQRYEVGAGVFLGPHFKTETDDYKDAALLRRRKEIEKEVTRVAEAPAQKATRQEGPRKDAAPKANRKTLVREWRKLLQRLEAPDAGLAGPDPEWLTCYAELLGDNERGKAIGNLKTLFEEIEEQYRDAVDAQKQRKSEFRLGVALGVFTELEHAVLKYMSADSKTGGLVPADQVQDINVPATHRYRWEIRPTVEWRPSRRWEFKANWYFKLPLGRQDTKIPGEATGRLDYRYDLDVRADFKVEEKELGQPGNVKVGIRYRRLFDNVPPFQEAASCPAEPPCLIAPNTHTSVTMEFGIGW